jgi:hypothetical protein
LAGRGFGGSNPATKNKVLLDRMIEYRGPKTKQRWVATNSLNDLKKAYPNYFADTAHFTAVLIAFLKNRP